MSVYGSDPNATIDQVTRDATIAASASGTPFANVAGDQGTFTTGADYYQKQGYKPSGATLEGVPTSFVDPKTGQVVAQYGVPTTDQNTSSHASNLFQWNPTSSLPQNTKVALAVPQTDYNTGLLDALKGAGMVIGGIGGAAGLASLGEAGALGDAVGSSLGGGDLAAPTIDAYNTAAYEAALPGAGAGADALVNGVVPAAESVITPATALSGASTLKSLLGLAGLGLAGASAAKALGGAGSSGGIGSISEGGGDGSPRPTAFNWNYQQPAAPVNGVAYGQKILNPQYSNVGMAKGGSVSGGLSDLGGYSDGGRMLKGPGDGMSDSIPASISGKRPARLATDEFVIPADVVSHLGNGSSDAGAKVLYHMMDSIRKARTGSKKQGKRIDPNKFVPA